MVLRKGKRLLISSKWNFAGVKTSVSFLKPYNFLITCCGRSKREYFRFSNKLLAPFDGRSKRSIFSLKNQLKFRPQQKFGKFLFDQFLTMIVDRDLILKIENLPLIFHPGDFAELGIRKFSAQN